MQNEEQAGEQPGLIASAGSLVRNALGLAITRIELAAVELGEARRQVFRLALATALGVLAAWFAIAWWSVLIVVLAWPTMGWTILALLGVVFTLAAFLAWRRVRSLLDEDKLGMPATLAELRRDRDTLI